MGNIAQAQSLTPILITDNLQGSQGVIAHDFNEDGKIEYVITLVNEDKVVILKEVNGQLIQEELLSVDSPIRLGVGDYNSDGMDDILVIQSLSAGIKVLRNNGNLEFSTQFLNSFDFEKGREFISEDLDQDGDIDLIVASPSNDKISLFEMVNPDFFSFNVSDIDVNLDNVGEISAADFNDDGNLDIVTCARFGSDVNIYLNDGALNFSKISVDTQPSPIGNTTGDFNNDELMDFAITDFAGAVIIYLNNGDNTFESNLIDVDLPEAVSIESMDVNADGNLDLAVSYEEGLAIYINLNPSLLTFEKEEIQIGESLSDFYIFDSDNDGDLDIVGSSASLSSVYLFENDLISPIYELENSTINIYPNPAKDVINIIVDGQLDYIASIYDLEGKLIKVSPNETKFDVKSLPQGCYFLELIDLNSRQRIVEKIVIQD